MFITVKFYKNFSCTVPGVYTSVCTLHDLKLNSCKIFCAFTWLRLHVHWQYILLNYYKLNASLEQLARRKPVNIKDNNGFKTNV